MEDELILEKRIIKNKIVEKVLWIHIFQDEIGACILPLREVEKSYDLLEICFNEEKLKEYFSKAMIRNLKVKVTFPHVFIENLFEYVIPTFSKMTDLINKEMTYQGDK